jgi:hypothetical protein
MRWTEVATIILERMSRLERDETARIDIPTADGRYLTETAIKLVKDTFGIWSFVIDSSSGDKEE